ncbi:MAG TPA: GTPase CgtA [Clostridiales bacterium]|nr:GTPase CgtA [Clostridiales bacterium]
MFVDIAKIHVKAGKGGNGSVAFRREKYEPMGGPAGGDGGKGGDIIIIADESYRTLMDFKYKKLFKAPNGEDGRNKKQYGAKGEDLILKVPVGTLVKDEETGIILADLNRDQQSFVVVKGGRGGRGNTKFKSSIRRTPRFAEPGGIPEERWIVLELKLIADVGLIGFPNVGKSTFLSVTTSANPKIANYHFTTLKPNLGVVKMPSGETFVLADIPGLIEGASQGIGLGHEFLRHIERTRLLLHVIDISGQEGRNPIDDFHKINEELRTYSDKLAEKKQIIVLNKIDLPGVEDNINLVRNQLGDSYQIFEISAATGRGIKEVLYAALEMMKSIPPEETLYDESEVIKLHNIARKDTINVYKRNEVYVADGYFLDVLVESTNFEDTESIRNFQKVLNDKGVVDRLRELGATEGDTVEICGIEFDFIE